MILIENDPKSSQYAPKADDDDDEHADDEAGIIPRVCLFIGAINQRD